MRDRVHMFIEWHREGVVFAMLSVVMLALVGVVCMVTATVVTQYP